MGHLINLTEAEGGEGSSRQKQAPEGKPGTETAAGDSLSVCDIKRSEEVQVGADEIHRGADQFTGQMVDEGRSQQLMLFPQWPSSAVCVQAPYNGGSSALILLGTPGGQLQ